MNKAFGNDDAAISDYVARTYVPEDEALAEIRARSTAAGLPDIQVAALDARHLEVLARLAGAGQAVEVGTLGGYSGLAILRGMGEGGTLDTIEIDPRHAEVAAESFRRAGVASRVRQHIGPGAKILPGLAASGPFDLVFIDADKESYPLYLDWAAANLRPGGVVILDNAFLFGHLHEPAQGQRATQIEAMQAVHDALARGGKFRATVLPTGEGLAVGVRV